jgi:LysM repeat protein
MNVNYRFVKRMRSGSGKKTLLLLSVVAFAFGFLRAQVMSTQEYIDAYKYAAMQEMKIYNIPASITLSQGILESGSGNSKLSRECNNHFGIKCRKEWTGPYCLVDDDAPNECFRGYSNPMESYRDHSLFLKGSSRYSSLFTLQVTDYEGWANGLRQAGYATNPAYATMLTGLIRKYRLGMYDSMALFGEDYVSPDTAAQRLIQVNGLPAIYAQKGQTPEDIARMHELGNWQVYKYNDLKRGEKLDPGEIVYLKPKRRKGMVAVATVKEGQDMRDVSQEYGIKLKHLYKKNNLKPGQQVKAGEVVSLQGRNPNTPTLSSGGVPEPVKTEQVEIPQPKVETENNSSFFHEVKEGESIYAIALKYSVSVDELVRWNNLESTSLKTGQLLVLKNGIKSELKDTSVSTGTVQVAKATQFHVVLKGETVYSIARLYNQPPDSIIAWNKIVNGRIYPGTEIRVSRNSGTKPTPSAPRTYTVQPGDTLYGIARKYGIALDIIRQKNNLQGDKIAVGQVLVLQ